MISETARYPDPVHSLPPKVRDDGERVHGAWDLDKLVIEGNAGGPIPSEHLAWLPSLPSTAPASLIRATYERDGVVHIRNLLPRSEVLSIRRQFFSRAEQSYPGVLKPGTSHEQGIYGGLFSDDEIDGNDPLADIRTGANYERFIGDFVQHPNVLKMAGKLKPEWREPWAFRQQVLRTNLPGARRIATRVHYDQMYLRGMEPDALTAWIPLGDISPVGGGLMYLENSVDLGTEIEGLFKKQNANLPEDAQLDAFNENMLRGGGLTTDSALFASSTRRRWMIADYRAGDVVFHQCCQVHCSANNTDPEGRIRLSTDVRFADKKASFEERWW